jgi:2,4-dienoyl-CoA reductase (NADPH2)
LLQEIALPADLVVYYAGKKAVDELAMPLRQSGVELHLVGDCMAPRRINNATLEAHTVGRRL